MEMEKYYTGLLHHNDLTNDTHGYSFLSNGLYSIRSIGLLHHLTVSHNLASVVNGQLSWKKEALYCLFGKFDKLNHILSVLTFILLSLSIQITEFLDHKLQNDLQNRNLNMLMGEMFLLA